MKPLGWREVGNYESAGGPASVPSLYGLGDAAYGSGMAVGSSIWLRQRRLGETGLYLGIVCESTEAVDAAYAAAIASGGIDQGKPADRAYFAPGYYAPTSLTLIATAWSSCTKPGTLGASSL